MMEMTDEDGFFDYIDEHDLMVLGWMHTRPTQSCFTSARDMLTHAGYQRLPPESFVMICALGKGNSTQEGEWGVSRLTDPPGKKTILWCTEQGPHVHDIEVITTQADHVTEIHGSDVEIVDLRR